MAAFVVDVNVAIVANGDAPQADPTCRRSCVQALVEVRKNKICLDDRDRILGEYRQNLSMSGQPGVGDEFMYWVHQNQYTTTVCERVNITEHSGRGFKEFPVAPQLSHFDHADRKYVAVALKSSNNPEILNAVDSDWYHYEKELQAFGANIRQLCPHCLKEQE